MWHVRVHKCLEPLCSATQCKCKPPLLKFGFEDVKQWWTLSPQSNLCFQHQIAWLCQSALPLNANCARDRKANQGSSKIESTLQYRLNLSNQFHLWKTISTIPITSMLNPDPITFSHRNCPARLRGDSSRLFCNHWRWHCTPITTLLKIRGICSLERFLKSMARLMWLQKRDATFLTRGRENGALVRLAWAWKRSQNASQSSSWLAGEPHWVRINIFTMPFKPSIAGIRLASGTALTLVFGQLLTLTTGLSNKDKPSTICSYLDQWVMTGKVNHIWCRGSTQLRMCVCVYISLFFCYFSPFLVWVRVKLLLSCADLDVLAFYQNCFHFLSLTMTSQIVGVGFYCT